MRVISTVGKLYTNCGSMDMAVSVGGSVGVPTCSAMGAKQLTNCPDEEVLTSPAPVAVEAKPKRKGFSCSTGAEAGPPISTESCPHE